MAVSIRNIFQVLVIIHLDPNCAHCLVDRKVKERHGLYFLEVKWLDMRLRYVGDSKYEISSGTSGTDSERNPPSQEGRTIVEIGKDFLQEKREAVQWFRPLGLEMYC